MTLQRSSSTIVLSLVLHGITIRYYIVMIETLWLSWIVTDMLRCITSHVNYKFGLMDQCCMLHGNLLPTRLHSYKTEIG